MYVYVKSYSWRYIYIHVNGEDEGEGRQSLKIASHVGVEDHRMWAIYIFFLCKYVFA